MSGDKPQNKNFRFKAREKLPRLSSRVDFHNTSTEVQTYASFAQPLKTTVGLRKFSLDRNLKRRDFKINSGDLSCDSSTKKDASSPKVNQMSLKIIVPVTYLPDFGSNKSIDANRKSFVSIRRSLKFSKYTDYSPSRKSVKIRSRFEKVGKSDPSLSIKGGLYKNPSK